MSSSNHQQPQPSTSIARIAFSGDLFEIHFRSYVISRITCYIGGQHRQDMQFDDCPPKVQEKILDEVERLLKQ